MIDNYIILKCKIILILLLSAFLYFCVYVLINLQYLKTS